MKKNKGLPIKTKPVSDDMLYDVNNMASANECTGLIPAAITKDSEAEAYEELYPIHPEPDKSQNE